MAEIIFDEFVVEKDTRYLKTINRKFNQYQKDKYDKRL